MNGRPQDNGSPPLPGAAGANEGAPLRAPNADGLAMAFGVVPWRMVTVVLPTAAVIMGDSLIYVVLPISAAEFGIGETLGLGSAFWIGAALSINRFVRAVSNPLAAFVYQKAGLRTPFIASVVLGALTTLTYAFSQGVWLLLAARAVWGVCYSFLRIAAFLVALQPETADMRGRLLGFFNSGQRLGSMAAVTVGAILVARTDKTLGFAVVAAAGVVGVLISLRAANFHVQPEQQASSPRGRPHATSVSDRVWESLVARLPDTAMGLRSRLLSIAALRAGLAFAANGLVIATISPYLLELAQSDSTPFGLAVAVLTLAGILVGIRWFADLALAVPFGHISDRVGRRRTVAVSMAITLAAVAVIGLAHSTEAIVFALPVFFFAGVAAQTALEAEYGETVPDESRAQALGRFTTWLDLGAAFGALAGLPLAEAFGFQATYFIAGGTLLVLCAGYFAAGARRGVSRNAA